MLSNYIIVNMKNFKTNRFHPIIFEKSPLPNIIDTDLHRYKSVGHHTTGFDTIEEAIVDCKATAERTDIVVTYYSEGLLVWDGEDVPARKVFFSEVNGEVKII